MTDADPVEKRETGGGRRRSESLRGGESQTESEMGEKRKVEGEMEEEENLLPQKAAQVLGPAVLRWPTESEGFWDLEAEKSPFLSPQAQDRYHDWPLELEAPRATRCCSSRDALKVGVALFTAALLFPFLVWGGYVFLPFDAPLLDSAPLRLVYTLRCAVFASIPIIMGWLVLGISRLRTGSVKPLCDGAEQCPPQVGVHQRFVSDSASLFLIYFLQLVVMAMYLSQGQLKLVPLLTIMFALGRLAYWLAASLGSSIRGFGFGLSFLPSVAMLTANLYFIFTVEAAGSIYAQQGALQHDPPPATRQRFWG